MASFLNTQLDFILFFYGLAFILLGATCIAIARIGGRDESWTLLALFGFMHGGGEWLDLTALVISDTPAFALARTALMTASFVLLMEFARQRALHAGLKVPGRWLYVPLLSLVVLGGAIDGLSSAGSIARYLLGFGGAAATALIFARYAKGFTGLTRYLAISAAAGFMLYALAAGIVVPASSFWPATVINYAWFDHVAGVPIQLVRGLIACWIAFSIWAIWGQQLVSEVASERYTQFLRRQFIWTLAAIATILVVGWMLTEFLGGIYKQNVEHQARGDIDLLVSRLAGETATVEGMVKALAGSRSVIALLNGGGHEAYERAAAIIALDVEASGAKVGYILDRSGAVVASSERAQSARAGATADRPVSYFAQAMAGAAGHQFAFDAQTGDREYYASYPVRAGAGAIVGVAVLEKSLAALAADLSEFDHAYFLVDPDGVVMLTNRPRLMLRALWPPAADQRAALERRFGTLNMRPMLEREIVDATWINFGGERDYVRRRDVANSRWSLVILNPILEIYASRVLGIVITLLVAIMALIYLLGKERWFHDSVQIERRLKLQDLARHLGLQATTDPLTGLNNRLKFDQALANELLRTARYKTPLALVMYDIDHFKAINDTHGHQIGDKVLTELAMLIAGNTRDIDVLARWGGEEFALMLPGCDAGMACGAAEKLRAAVERANFEAAGTVTCSFGVAQYVDGDSAATLVARADEALYRAKLDGRNRAAAAPPPAQAEPRIASVA